MSVADSTAGGPAGRVPAGVRTAAAWSWRLPLNAAAVYVLAWLASVLGMLVLSLFGGLLLTALLRPAADRLQRWGLPRLAASLLLLLASLAALGAVGWLIEWRIASEAQMLQQDLATGIDRLRDLLIDTFGLPPDRLDGLASTLIGEVLGIGADSGGLGIVRGAEVAVSVLGAVALVLFTTFWLVYDGRRIGRGLVRLLPRRARATGWEAGSRAWDTLGGYLRGITVVALFDGIGIGVALALIGIPLPLTLGLLTFLGAYVPMVGAAVAGAAAVLVALAAEGTTAALLTAAAVVVVQQIEGQVLYPVVMGRALPLHPMTIVYALTAGALLYGVAGAVLAVPLAAVLHVVLSVVVGRAPDPAPGGAGPTGVSDATS